MKSDAELSDLPRERCGANLRRLMTRATGGIEDGQIHDLAVLLLFLGQESRQWFHEIRG
jgi:hypothetical protein